MQFHFLEDDLEKLWVPHSIRDIRQLPGGILTPIIAVQMDPKQTLEPALSSHINLEEELKSDLISRMTHFMYHL